MKAHSLFALECGIHGMVVKDSSIFDGQAGMSFLRLSTFGKGSCELLVRRLFVPQPELEINRWCCRTRYHRCKSIGSLDFGNVT